MRASQRSIDDALALLYGPGPRPDDPLSMTTLKRAWHRRAHALHPDRAVTLGVPAQRLEAAFKRVEAAYRLLREVASDSAVSAGASPSPSPSPSPARPSIPNRPLRFAEYLYFTGWVSREDAAASLTWQRRARPLIGQLAVAWGYLTASQLGDLLQQRRASPRYRPLASYALEQGYLSAHQRVRLVRHQRALRRPVGRYFVDAGILTPQALAQLLEAHRRHNAAA